MKNFIFFVMFFVLLSSLAFGQTEFQPVVFSPADFFTPGKDLKMSEVGRAAAWLPRNLPRTVQVGNQWWAKGEQYVPKGWPIPTRDLGITGSCFGWYKHRADSALHVSPEQQIRALGLPEDLNKILIKQINNGLGVRGTMYPRTLTNAMVYFWWGKIIIERNAIWLGNFNLSVVLYPQVEFEGSVYQLGVSTSCNNYFFWQWKLPEKQVVVAIPVTTPATTTVDTTPKVVITVTPPAPSTHATTTPNAHWKPQLRSWGYIGAGGNKVAKEFGVNYSWQYAGIDIEFLPVHWFGFIAKSTWARSSDNFWGQKNQVWRPMVGVEVLQPHFVIRSLYGRDYQNGKFLLHNVWEEGLELYPMQRTILAVTGVYINKPGDQWDYLWSRAQAKYATSVSNNNTRKLWFGAQASWMGMPGWERELAGKKQRPEEYTTRVEGLAEMEFGQRRNLVLQVTAGVGSKSVGRCGSATVIFRIL